VERSDTHHRAARAVTAAMGIAEPVIGRAFARPVGSTHPTRPVRSHHLHAWRAGFPPL